MLLSSSPWYGSLSLGLLLTAAQVYTPRESDPVRTGRAQGARRRWCCAETARIRRTRDHQRRGFGKTWHGRKRRVCEPHPVRWWLRRGTPHAGGSRWAWTIPFSLLFSRNLITLFFTVNTWRQFFSMRAAGGHARKPDRSSRTRVYRVPENAERNPNVMYRWLKTSCFDARENFHFRSSLADGDHATQVRAAGDDLERRRKIFRARWSFSAWQT